MGWYFFFNKQMDSKGFYKFEEAVKSETFQVFIIDSTQKLSDNLFIPFYSFLFAKTQKVDLVHVITLLIKKVLLSHFCRRVTIK
jgi:hypothetical protein